MEKSGTHAEIFQNLYWSLFSTFFSDVVFFENCFDCFFHRFHFSPQMFEWTVREGGLPTDATVLEYGCGALSVGTRIPFVERNRRVRGTINTDVS